MCISSSVCKITLHIHTLCYKTATVSHIFARVTNGQCIDFHREIIMSILLSIIRCSIFIDNFAHVVCVYAFSTFSPSARGLMTAGLMEGTIAGWKGPMIWAFLDWVIFVQQQYADMRFAHNTNNNKDFEDDKKQYARFTFPRIHLHKHFLFGNDSHHFNKR